MGSDEEPSQLQSFARSRPLPAVWNSCARLVLASTEGDPNNSIAARLKITEEMVGKWRTRFLQRHIAGHTNRKFSNLRFELRFVIAAKQLADLVSTRGY